jgi:hypothetical protein
MKPQFQERNGDKQDIVLSKKERQWRDDKEKRDAAREQNLVRQLASEVARHEEDSSVMRRIPAHLKDRVMAMVEARAVNEAQKAQPVMPEVRKGKSLKRKLFEVATPVSATDAQYMVTHRVNASLPVTTAMAKPLAVQPLMRDERMKKWKP